MSTNNVERVKRKKTDPQTQGPSPAPEGDHRKRRRNRTTQSCLNCHTSKRMEKAMRTMHPTWSCSSRLNWPPSSSDAADDRARLQKRVAELEGVIRELKNKPHPRWTQQTSVSTEEWARSGHGNFLHLPQQRIEEDQDMCRPTTAESGSTSSDGIPTALLRKASLSSNAGPPSPPFGQFLDVPPPHFGSPPRLSPMSSHSPLVTTPRSEEGLPSFVVTSPSSSAMPHEDPMASFFSYFSDAEGFDGGQFGSVYDGAMHGVADDHMAVSGFCHPEHKSLPVQCGCLMESANYSIVLELSLRLRRAAELLSRHPSHATGGLCLLKQRIHDLDALTTSTLGNMEMPGGSEPSTMHPHSAPEYFQLQIPDNQGYGWANAGGVSGMPSTVSPLALSHPGVTQTQSTWAPEQSFGQAQDDAFMSWEPHRRRSSSIAFTPTSS
ncbi:hypothetical protein OF83DRAFT_1085889 [Amylostereum chailletii]|nr:hypothetical protein OF83DRAFT_1085889 [Amylostereum chailletii]